MDRILGTHRMTLRVARIVQESRLWRGWFPRLVGDRLTWKNRDSRSKDGLIDRLRVPLRDAV